MDKHTKDLQRAVAVVAALGLLVVTFRHLDVTRTAALLGHLGPSAALLLLPSCLALCLETAAWRGAFSLLGEKTRFFSLLRIRIATESLGAALPLGVVWSESMKPRLLHRHEQMPAPSALAGMTARKYLLLAAQAGYLLAGFVLGQAMLRSTFGRLAGMPGLAATALVASVALAATAELLRAALARGAIFRSSASGIGRIPWRPLKRALAGFEQQIARTDASAARFFGAPRRVLLPLVGLCFGAWLLEATETWLVLHALGSRISWGDALGVEAVVVLARHVLVALPGGLGAQELGYAAFLGGTDAGLGVCAAFALVKRLKELVWVAIGYGLLATDGASRAPSSRFAGVPRVQSATRALSLLLTALSVSTCMPPAAPARALAPRVATSARDAERTVIVVAIDGVRYEDVFVGADPELAARHGIPENERRDAPHLLPNLTRLATESGASLGAPGVGEIAASGPNFVSLPGYMEILTGRTRTGCTDNQCGRVSYETIADEIASTGREAGAVTSWPDIGKAASSTSGHIVASVGRHGGSRREVLESDPHVAPYLHRGEHGGPDPGYGDFRPDALTGDVAVAYLESRTPAFLFVGLGETDEYGHRDDYRSYLDALSRADSIIGRLAEVANDLTRQGHDTTLFVTTDHGREKRFESHGREHPESARVFLFAAGAGIAARGRVASPVTRHLADLAPTIRQLVGLPTATFDDAGRSLTELLQPARERDLRLVDLR